MPDSVAFVIGNSYGGFKSRNRHDWTLYVDFFGGGVELVQKVQFQIKGPIYARRTSHCPVTLGGGSNEKCRWRFHTRNKTFGPTRALVTIVGRGGSVRKLNFRIRLAPGGKEGRPAAFHERRSHKPLRPVPIANKEFGIELELSTSSGVSTRDVAELIRADTGADVRDMTNDYAAASSCNDAWVIMTDSSLVCSRDTPECNRFELKSPILRGEGGLAEVGRVVRALGGIRSSMNVNSSMGFHVHVNIAGLSKFGLTSVCQNFVKYERAMDSLMPPSRREGNGYCRSNRLAVGATDPVGYSRDIGEKLASCKSTKELAELMCPGDKFYKLNLRPFLARGKFRKPTIEFRQHSSTYDERKIKNWIRFCVSFVRNSARSRPPRPLADGVDDLALLDMLMMRVVRDRCLRDHYRQRRLKFLKEERGDCCQGCAFGDGCEARMSNSKQRAR